MKEVKLPEIKLFGKKIALPENKRVEAGENSSGKSGRGKCNENSSGSDSNCYLNPTPRKVCQVEESDDKDVDKQETDKISLAEECSKTKSEDEGNDPMVEKPQNPKDLSDCDNSPDTPSLDEDSAGKQSPDSENDQTDTNNTQGKNLKKPDKIIPCPRCNSMETKFCYYNNYNVNQPRHFCKSCQRYWTAGGTMRNVPVGAGRRKNKNSISSNCRHITISEALHAAQFDAANTGFHNPNVNKPNGTVLSFGPELPLNDSTSTTALLKLNKLGEGTESGNDFSKGSNQETVMPCPFPTPVPYFHNMPCPFPTPVPIPVPVPAICPPGFPMPFYPTPIWNGGIAGSWSFPWLPPVFQTANQKPSGSPTLGKHSRDGGLLPPPKNLEDKETLQDPKGSEGSILIPKTLRIGDPEEAAMSSIWTTLGIKCDSTNRGGLFKAAFQPKIGEKKQPAGAATSPLLQANPAAFSRSINFQEIA